MKRFVLILRIFVPLVILMALISVGCDEVDEWAEVSKDKVMVGEPVTLSVHTREGDTFGCAKSHHELIEGNMYSWSVDPSNGATVKDGVFVASKPGKYNVTPVGILTAKPWPRTITVEGTAAETFTTETTATATTTTTKPSETTAEEEITTEEETTTETDVNLHGVVPTKVTVHTHQATDNEDSYSDHYIEFWNIGELGGEQYAKATDHYIATSYGAQSSEIAFEGTFTGGPNGLIEMSAVSSSGNDEGSTAKVVIQLIDGKQLQNPSNGYILQIVNPEALVGAFDGWKD